MNTAFVRVGLLGSVSVFLIAALGTTRRATTAGHPGPAHTLGAASQPPTTDLLAWRAATGADGIVRATARTTAAAVAPPFDTVRLDRTYGAAAVGCGPLSGPVLTEDGTAREWTYAAPSPGAGPCTAPGGGRFTAVGIRAGVATRTEPFP